MANGGTVRRPAVPPPVRIRRNINSLPVDHPILTFYGRAIGAMKAKPLNDPLSWRYQAAIHDYPFPDTTFDDRRVTAARPDGDPLAVNGEALPADRGTFWRKCQHNSWAFLPWHRMYLHHFEKIVLNEVIRLGGPADWALPYWDWSATDGAGRLPIPFRSATLSDGSQNHLFVAQRNTAPGRNANAGEQIAGPAQTDSAFACLGPTVFTGVGEFGGPPVFVHGGEGPPETPPAIVGRGLLEGTPHGSMHVRTGGDGWMSAFTQAALDPIFWCHHCNIDRIWEVWIQRAPGNVNPTDTSWLDQSFAFHDANGGDGTLTPRQVMQTRRAPLLYEYDDTSNPPGSP